MYRIKPMSDDSPARAVALVHSPGDVSRTSAFASDKHIRFIFDTFVDVALQDSFTDWREGVHGGKQRAISSMVLELGGEAFSRNEFLGLWR